MAEDLPTELTHPEYLVSTGWLAARLDDPEIRVLDVTAKLTSSLENQPGAELVAGAHIPGSYPFDVASGKGLLSDPDAVLPWMWPPAGRLADTLARFGIGADTRVVLVARTPRAGIDSGTMWCTRAWWTLHRSGVRCSILRGGIEAWEGEGRPLTDEPSPPPESPTVPVAIDPGWIRFRATKADVAAAVTDLAGPRPQVCLVDALTPDNFDGTAAGYGRPGHITGAVNVPFRGLITAETADFVEPATMARALDAAGLFDTPRIITYCGGAIAATVDAFCLALFGRDDVAVYDGSLMEWAADPDAPMTNPAVSPRRGGG
ncbi:MAG: sulfurtransferase [Acidimicrobiales bacterium]